MWRRRQDLKPGPHYRQASVLTTTPPLLPRSFFSMVPYSHFLLMSMKSELTEWAFSFTTMKRKSTKQRKKTYGNSAWYILGDRGADSGGEGKSKRAEKHGTKKSKERWEEPLGTMSYQTSSKRSPLFWLLISARKRLCFSAQNLLYFYLFISLQK